LKRALLGAAVLSIATAGCYAEVGFQEGGDENSVIVHYHPCGLREATNVEIWIKGPGAERLAEAEVPFEPELGFVSVEMSLAASVGEHETLQAWLSPAGERYSPFDREFTMADLSHDRVYSEARYYSESQFFTRDPCSAIETEPRTTFLGTISLSIVFAIVFLAGVAIFEWVAAGSKSA
jgi:hypothetical protein